MKIIGVSSFICVLHFFCLADLCEADLVYHVTPQQLINDGNGQAEEITGGEIRMVDGADSDGILTPAELISMTVYNSLGENGITKWDESAPEGGVYFDTLQFDNGNLVGRLDLQDFSQDGAWIKYGSDPGFENSLFILGQSEYATGDWNSPFVIATSSAVPEPAGLGICLLLGYVGMIRNRRRALTVSLLTSGVVKRELPNS